MNVQSNEFDAALHHWLETGNSKPLVDKAALVAIEDTLGTARSHLVIAAVHLDQVGRAEAARRVRGAILVLDSAGELI